MKDFTKGLIIINTILAIHWGGIILGEIIYPKRVPQLVCYESIWEDTQKTNKQLNEIIEYKDRLYFYTFKGE